MSDQTRLTPEKAFETLKQTTTDAISSYFPFDGKRQRLELSGLRVDDKLAVDDITSQTDAKDKQGTWGVPIKGDLKLIDKATGKVIDTKKGAVLGRIPKLTNRYSYIVGGSEYQVDHLFRLKSGVYARVQDNGDLESEFNLAKRPAGQNFQLKLDRVNKKFTLVYGAANIPLYPLLKSLGVGDDEIEHSWGKEIFAANKPATAAKFEAALRKFHDKTSDDPTATKNLDDLHKHVNDFFNATGLREDTTKLTLGKPYDKVNGEVLHVAANKLLGISRGTHQLDDRDSLAFKEVVSVEDFIPEKLQRSGMKIRSRLRNNIDQKSEIGEIISTDIFNRPITEFFSKGGSVAERSDQTNPLQMLSAHRKTTIMSKDFGGIKSDMSLTQEMRSVNQSHLGFLDPMHTPESEKTGITLHLAANARKNGRTLEIPVYDTKEGKPVWVNIEDFHTSSAILPDQVTWKNGKPTPVSHTVKMKAAGGDIVEKPASEARYVLHSAKGMFNYASNLIPFLPANNGNRVMMADKQMEQAIGLKHREVPLVQTKTDHPTDPEHTFEKFIGHFVASRTPVAGTVLKVDSKGIDVKMADGKKHRVHLYDNFPLNDPKGMLHSEPLVAVGDKVQPGQVLADNNHTKGGVLASGINLRVGYIPYKGYNFEDGIVISESAAKKLTSEHLHRKELDIEPDRDFVSKEKLKAFGVTRSAVTPTAHWDALDENGVIKPGTRVEHGQLLIAAVGKNDVRKQSFLDPYGKKRAWKPYRDKSLVWDEDHSGVVTKVVRDTNGKGIRVYVRTDEPMVIGDKLTGRHGNKGIVTLIVPDEKMPFTLDKKTGEKRHIEVALNPSGIPTRINVGQMLETAAAKIAEKTGKPYLVNNFSGPHHDYRKQVEDDLKKHGLSDEELIYDAEDVRKPLGSVLVGPQYIFKLKHQVDKKLNARGGGTDIAGKALPNDVDKQPVRGGDNGGQGFGALELYSLLGHDARHNIREMATYKSDMQDMTFWNLIQTGQQPPAPKPSFAYNKFVGLLQGLGVNVTKQGTEIRINPMNNKEVLQLAGRREIKEGAKTLRSKDLKPHPGGLFDPLATGGIDGDKWSYIRLAEPVPNPLFCGAGNATGPVPVLLNMKMKDLEDVMHGRQSLHGKVGGPAIEEALKKINVQKEIESLRKELPDLTGADLDRTNKKLKYLLALEDQKLKPHEAYMMHYLPVVPPKFRPATPTPAGDVNYAPLNGHYKNVAVINDKIREFDPKVFTKDHKQPLRSQLWDAVRSLQAVGGKPAFDSDSSGNRELAGILDTIARGGVEGQPKEGYFQDKLIKRRQNLSIRSTIIPDPALGLDEVGIPRGAAMEMYKPYVVAQMKKWGYEPLKAQEEMKKPDSPVARRALEEVVKDRPLILKRDPALHKFNVMAFNPKLVEGKAIQIHPLVTGGYNADFDGDTMAGTIPMSTEAVEEAKKLFPSNNLFSPTNYGVMYLPGHEALLGLHLLSKWGKRTDKKYSSVESLSKAVDKGEVHATDVVSVGGFKKPTTYGRVLLESRMPRGMSNSKDLLHDPTFEITKKSMRAFAPEMAKKHADSFPKAVNSLKDLGNEWSFKMGFSFGLKDITTIPERDKIIKEYTKKADHAMAGVKSKADKDAAMIAVWGEATDKLDEAQKALGKRGNRLAIMVNSGARGDKDQLRQMVSAPMLLEDEQGKVMPYAIKRSLSEGLDVGDFWMYQHGARKGTLQKNRGTAEPGALTKDIVNASMSTLIVSPDCGTTQGISMHLRDSDIHDRYTASPYKLRGGQTVPAGTLITPELLTRLKNSKHENIQVRSPLKCSHGNGICNKCFGLNESGKHHAIGTNIGILASQAMGEPSTQLSMRAFHSGGVAGGSGGGKFVDTLTRFGNLLEMPAQIKNEATTATATGKITHIKKDAVGGQDIYVDNVRHFVPRDLVDPNVKVGDDVRKGKQLSKGFTNPHKLLHATKDIHQVQQYLTKELHDGLFDDLGVRRRNIEVAVRSITNLAKVKDPSGSEWLHGDVIPRSMVEEHNRNLGRGQKPVEYEPILKGTGEIPHLITKDWLQRMNYQRLHLTVQQAAAMGQKSDIHSTNPIPGIVHGAEFGKPPAGKPKFVY
jgi:DNA-directed RNA polymerase subunit beta'